METETISIKGGPYFFKGVSNFSGRQELVVPFAMGYNVRVSVAESCETLLRLWAENGLPAGLSSSLPARIQHYSSTLVSCSILPNKKLFQLQNLEVNPIEIVSVRQAPINELLSREEYGPADRAVARELDISEPQWGREIAPHDRSFHWNEEKLCWAVLNGECSELAATICVPDL